MAHADKSNGDAQGPYLRLDPPKFNGDDPSGWVFKVDKYLDYYRMSEEDRLHFVGLLFEQPALDWLIYQQNHNLLRSWPEFLEAVEARFDPLYYENHIILLCKLQQMSTVMEYQTEFERLLIKVKGVPEAHLVSICKSGLSDLIRREVHLRRPATLSETFALAREFEMMYVKDEGLQ